MTSKLNAKAAIWAGLVAGFVFLVMEMVLVGTVGGGSPWGPPRMIGAILLGRDVLPPPATFDFGVVLVAMLIHFLLSVIYGLVLGWIISMRRMGLGASMGAGVLFGLLIYLVNFYGFTALFPWFAEARTPITVIAHVAFGLVLGWVYHALVIRHYAARKVVSDRSAG